MSAVDVRIDTGDMRSLYQGLRAIDSDLTVGLRRGVKAAAKPIQDAIKAEAASFSTRIPGAIKTKASFSGRNTSVVIYADSKIAPHAAPINNKGRAGRFRHPVYADGAEPRGDWTWVDQNAHPFVQNIAMQHEADAERAIDQIMDEIARRAGFK